MQELRTILRHPLLYVMVAVVGLWVVALSTAEPKYEAPERPRLAYSFPPTCPEVDISGFGPGEIDAMAQRLGLTKVYDGAYYQNGAGACFRPEQIPVLHENRDAYEQELAEHW